MPASTKSVRFFPPEISSGMWFKEHRAHITNLLIQVSLYLRRKAVYSCFRIIVIQFIFSVTKINKIILNKLS